MKIVLGVEGMMCNMCEKHVKEALEENFKAEKVEASHEKSSVVFEAAEAPTEAAIKDVIEEEGYKLTSYQVQ